MNVHMGHRAKDGKKVDEMSLFKFFLVVLYNLKNLSVKFKKIGAFVAEIFAKQY